MSKDEPVQWFRRHDYFDGSDIHTVSWAGVVNRDQVGDISVVRGSMRRSPATKEFALPANEHPLGGTISHDPAQIPGQKMLWGYEPGPPQTTVDTLYSSPEHRMTGVPQVLGMMANYAEEEGWDSPEPSTAMSAYSHHLSERLVGGVAPNDDPSDRKQYVEDLGGQDSPFEHQHRQQMEEVPEKEVHEGTRTMRKKVKSMRQAQRAESQPTQGHPVDPKQGKLF